MAPKILHYKDIDAANDVELTVPEKIKGRHFSYASRKGQKGAVYVKSPTGTVESVYDDCLRIKFKEDSPINDFMRSWDERCKQVVFDNSERFFNGKRFSMQKIESSYVPTLTDSVLCVKVRDDVVIRDQREAPRTLSELAPGQEIIMILNIDGLAYTATSISLIVNAEQIKVYIDDKLQDFLISQEDDETTEVQSTEQTVETAEADPSLPSLPEQTPAEIEDLQDSSKPDNDDEKNLF